MTLKQFIKDETINRNWINERNISVYIRRSKRVIGGQLCDCLDLANVSVDEHMQGKGIFSRFLVKFEKEARKLNRIVYLENVLEQRFQIHLIDVKKYTLLDSNHGVVTLYKK